jgi:superfamily II DNA or RNA helicase
MKPTTGDKLKFEDLFSRLSSESHIKGKSFEKISKWWLTNDEIWSSLVKKVWLWDEWPNRNTRDLGIDLVAEGFDGSLWAIQCKAYDPESSLKKADIDSFLSASSQKQFTNRLLITTTKSIGENARNTISDQEKPVQIVDWIRLSESSVDWSLAEKGIKTRSHTPRTLRPHQQDALTSVINGFSKTDRGQLIMACGTGKTLTGLRINEAMGNELTVLLVPSLTLLSQTLKDWLTDKKTDFKWLAVCSDDSVTSDPQDNARLVDYDLPATTDIKVIQKFLESTGKKVIFSTYQSSDILKSAVLKSKVRVDLVIADEAHRLAGKVGREFASFLAKDLPVTKRLFMTATPRVYANSIKKMSESLDIEILSMDEKEIFGEVLYRYSFSKAISEGILSDYRVVVIGIDDISTKELFNKRALVTAGVVETDSESLALHVALSKAMKQWNLRRVISFHSRVAKARKFAGDQVLLNEWMPKEYAVLGKLNATTISSSMPTNKRRQILDVLKNLSEGETGLVSNARCLTEGIDVPTLDAVVFVDPKTSQVDIIQAIGRAIRLGGANKTHGTVVVPIHVPKDRTSKDSFDSTSFKKIGDVLNALRSHDEDFGEELDKLRTSLGQRGSMGDMPEKLIWDMPVTISEDFVTRIQAVSVEFATSNWDFMFGQLLAFIQSEGHARPPKGDTAESRRLSEWVTKQRGAYRLNQLSLERVESLEKTHETWSWDPIEDDWSEYYNSLREFIKVHGHARPTSSRTETAKLGEWIINQRENYKAGKLSQERIALLQNSHSSWSWNPLDDDWNFMYELLKNFESKNGHTRVKATHKEDGYGLGSWVHGQRSKKLKKRKRSQELSGEQISKLESLKTWTWDTAEEDIQKYITAVKEFESEFGSTRIPASFRHGDVYLGKWVSHQRDKYKRGKLSKSIIRELEDNFPDWSWDRLQDDWERNFQALEKYVTKNGNARVAYDVVFDGQKIGIWVSNLKSRFKAGKLTAEQIKRIEATHPTWTWTLLDQQWEEFFEKLQSYEQEHGNCNVSSKGQTKDERVLYEWVNTQRKRFKQNKLPEARKARLEAIGFSFEPIDPWIESYEVLLAYVTREGTANIPVNHIEDGYFLGRWASKMRGSYKAKELTDEQIKLLEKLPEWNWVRSSKK